MEETLSIITVGISVYWKNGHTVPDQQLGCPEAVWEAMSPTGVFWVRKGMCQSNLTHGVYLNPPTQCHFKIL